MVDALLGQQDIVVAPFDAPRGMPPYVGGATILADGAPALCSTPPHCCREERMEDVRGLKELQLDALREVANIGAGHAATALSQMTNHTIMIAVPEVNVRPLEEVTDLVGRPDEVVAAVLMHMMGDLTGRTLVLFPEGSARTLCDILFRRSAGTTGEFGPMEQSGLKEAGNILASAYMNALSDFMGMMLVPSVPSLVIDLSARDPHHHLPQLRPRPRLRLLRRDVVPGRGCRRAAARPFPAPARHAVAQGHLRRHPPALIRCPGPCLSERDLAVLRSFARRIDPSDAGAHNNLGVLYYQKGLIEDAITEFVRALELDPRMQVAQTNLDIAYRESGHYDRRVTELQERVRRQPEDRDARWELGRAHAALGRHPDAIAEFQALLAWHPSDVPAMLQLGLAEKARGNLDTATDWLARACEQDPTARWRASISARCSTTGGSTSRRSPRCARRSRATPTTPRRTTSSPSSTATWAGTRTPARPPSAPSSSIPRWRGRRPTSRSIATRRTAPQVAGAATAPPSRPQIVEGGALAHYNLGWPSGRRACTTRRSASTGSRSTPAKTGG